MDVEDLLGIILKDQKNGAVKIGQVGVLEKKRKDKKIEKLEKLK